MANSDVRFVYTDDDGMLIIVCPADKTERTLDEIKTRNCPTTNTIYTVQPSDCPTDRSFRDAWSYDGSNFGINITKAKEIHKENIRLAREKKFKELDVEFQRALETSADTTDIVAKKQVLRDYPAQAGISTAVTDTDLKANWDTTILGDSPYS